VGAVRSVLRLQLDFTIDFPHPVFGSENRRVVIDFASLVREGGRAGRTFGFMQDVEGHARGRPRARWQPAERRGAGRVPRAQRRGLRYDNEFVKHKVLGAIGTSARLQIRHRLNNALARRCSPRPMPSSSRRSSSQARPSAFQGGNSRPDPSVPRASAPLRVILVSSSSSAPA
jgi:hypothetical protein